MIAEIKKIAHELGFDAVGIVHPSKLKEGEQAILDWVSEGRHGGMKYLEDFSARQKKFYEDFPDAKSIIVLGANYFTNQKPVQNPEIFQGRVARYAWGKDYHLVIADRHQELIRKMQLLAGENFRAKSCVDTQPIPERFAAMRAGLGFSGKHTGLLNPQFGPWLFLSEIVTNLDLPEDKPSPGSCGTCVDCQKICPTGALDQDYKIDARRCIAYLTIEHKGVIPREMRPLIKDWVFGCDECFEVCPFTSKSRESRWPELGPKAGAGQTLDIKDLLEVRSNKEFEKRFAGTALLRVSRKQMLRNACVVLGNSQQAEAVPYLKKALEDSSSLVRIHALWALAQIPSAEAWNALKAHRDHDPEVQQEVDWLLSDA